MDNERFMKLVKICERAEDNLGEEYVNHFGSRASRLMDLESADKEFNLRLDEFLKADKENFYHDVIGIWGNSNRETYPCTFGIFVPRFSGEVDKNEN